MGGYTHTQDIFLNVAMGKMGNKKLELSYDGWVGQLVGIRRKMAVWENNEIPKIELRMVDKDGVAARISFGAETFYALGFFSRITRVNVAEPFLLGVWNDKKKNEKLSLCFIKQHEVIVKAPEKGSAESLPQPVKVKVGGKEVVDWTAPSAAFDKIIADLQARIGKLDAPKPHDPTDGHPATEEGSDLPF